MLNWIDELFKSIEDYTICTDSDVEDFAAKHHLDTGKVFKAIAVKQTEGTPCEGCKHIMMLPNMHPCINCSRLHKIDYTVFIKGMRKFTVANLKFKDFLPSKTGEAMGRDGHLALKLFLTMTPN